MSLDGRVRAVPVTFRECDVKPTLPTGSVGNCPRTRSRIYIQTLEDKAIGPSAQEAMYTKLPCQGIVVMPTRHSPFYCGPSDFVAKLREAVVASGT